MATGEGEWLPGRVSGHWQWPEHWWVKQGAPALDLFCSHLLPCDKVLHTQYPPIVSVRSETESG